MIIQKARYAVKALIHIARKQQEGLVSVAEIAKAQQIPVKFLEAILNRLKAEGLVVSYKGKTGGYRLALEPEHIHLTKVVRATKGPIALLSCVSLNFYEPCGDCLSEDSCALHHVFSEVRDATLKILSSTSIADLLRFEDKQQPLPFI